MPFTNGQVTVTTSPTPLCTIAGRGGVLIQNNGSAPVFLGGLGVAVSGAGTGISVAAGATVFVPTAGSGTVILYGVVATSSQPVVFLFPSD
jgi:hypothetical protein